MPKDPLQQIKEAIPHYSADDFAGLKVIESDLLEPYGIRILVGSEIAKQLRQSVPRGTKESER